MNKIQTSDLKEGMKFDKPVYIDGNNLFIPPNIAIKQKDIDRLIRWEIQEVETEGNIIKEISEPMNLHEIDIEIKEIVKPKETLYANWINQLDEIFDDIKNKRLSAAGSDHKILDIISQELLNEIDKNPEVIFQNIVHSQKNKILLPTNALNSACISAVIGKYKKMPPFRIMQLIVGSLLHDSGMLRIPETILNKTGKLTQDELNQVKMHTIYSYQIILQELKYPEDVAVIVLYHHEKWDGTGYPKNIKGDSIPVGARILAVADAYEAMLNQRPYRDAFIGYNAMKNMLSDNGTHFDPSILKIFLKCVGFFPIGSYILLNNSKVGRVIAVNSSAPMRPRIRLIFDENGNKVIKDNDIDLLDMTELFILKAIDPRELKKNQG